MTTEPKTQAQDSESSNGAKSDVKKNIRERLFLPFAIPLGAAAVVALLGISFSRIFLAGGHEGAQAGVEEAAKEASKSPAPVMWAIIITLVVLLGAAGLSLMKSMRTKTLVLLVSGFLFASLLAGSVLAGTSDVKEETALFGSPTEAELAAADPVPKLDIEALPSNSFQSKEFESQAGIVEIDYIGKGGGHRLVFKDSKFSWFDLSVNGTSSDSAPINLDAGTYYVYCPIPGHEAAGMFADLVVK